MKLPGTESKYWKQLSPEERSGATALGYTSALWDSNGLPKSDDKRWNTLTSEEKRGALALGYGEKLWNGELDSRPVLPPGGEKVADLVKAADLITNAIDNHLTTHKANQDPSSSTAKASDEHNSGSPEEHDARMQADIDSHNSGPPEAHDARMQADIDEHNSGSPEANSGPEAQDAQMQADIDAHNNKQGTQQEEPTDEAKRAAVVDAAPFHAHVAQMGPEVVQVWKQAKHLFARVPESSTSFQNAKVVFDEIKQAVEGLIKSKSGGKDSITTDKQLDGWLQANQGGAPNKGALKVDVVEPPNGVPVPMEQVENDTDPLRSFKALEGINNSFRKHEHITPNEVPGKETRPSHEAGPGGKGDGGKPDIDPDVLANARAKQVEYSEGLIRRIKQYHDDRSSLVHGNKQIIGKITGFFSAAPSNKAGPAAPSNKAGPQMDTDGVPNHFVSVKTPVSGPQKDTDGVPNNSVSAKTPVSGPQKDTDGVPNHFEQHVSAKAPVPDKAEQQSASKNSNEHEAATGKESMAPASQISDGEHVPGDETMSQGEHIEQKTSAEVHKHEAASGNGSLDPASQISDGEHVPGDETMSQGEQDSEERKKEQQDATQMP